MIRAVFFDVGETLVDETRQWSLWADWLHVPRLTFLAVFGAMLERGEHHRRVFDYFAPGADLNQLMRAREAAGAGYKIEVQDFYPDALPVLAELRKQGYFVGIVGNQPENAVAALNAAGVVADLIASSSTWGVEKPSPLFFERIIETTQFRPDEIAYVGDRLDNDIIPAAGAGLYTVFIERGPWGILQARNRDIDRADKKIRSLFELSAVLRSGS